VEVLYFLSKYDPGPLWEPFFKKPDEGVIGEECAWRKRSVPQPYRGGVRPGGRVTEYQATARYTRTS